jgi:tRNA 5-methylaminomethyl-2-thiouridine biosynthesis bifunctional protein
MPALAARIAPERLERRASVRATTPDRLPLAGAIEPGLFVLGGLGGRGFTWAPLLAEHVAARVTGAPSPLPLELSEVVSPDRFERRAARRRAS